MPTKAAKRFLKEDPMQLTVKEMVEFCKDWCRDNNMAMDCIPCVFTLLHYLRRQGFRAHALTLYTCKATRVPHGVKKDFGVVYTIDCEHNDFGLTDLPVFSGMRDDGPCPIRDALLVEEARMERICSQLNDGTYHISDEDLDVAYRMTKELKEFHEFHNMCNPVEWHDAPHAAASCTCSKCSWKFENAVK
jgi:hypothetical protein